MTVGSTAVDKTLLVNAGTAITVSILVTVESTAIDKTLPVTAGTTITMQIANRYNTYNFGGSKVSKSSQIFTPESISVF